MNLKIKKQLKELEKMKMKKISVGNVVIFSNVPRQELDKFSTYVVIDVRKKKIFGYGLSKYLYEWLIPNAIIRYVKVRYGFNSYIESVPYEWIFDKRFDLRWLSSSKIFSEWLNDERKDYFD